jgi:hypothetical protein
MCVHRSCMPPAAAAAVVAPPGAPPPPHLPQPLQPPGVRWQGWGAGGPGAWVPRGLL